MWRARPVIPVWLAIASLGCSGGEDTGKTPADTNPPPFGSDTGYGVAPIGEPGLDLAGVESALDEGVRLVRSLDPADLLDLMDQLLSQQDQGVCPSFTETDADYYDLGRPQEVCTASSDAVFQVDLRYMRDEEGQDGASYLYENALVVGGSRIVDSAGEALDFSLKFTHTDRVISTGNRKIAGQWFGVSTWSGATAGEWLGGASSVGLEYMWVTETDSTTAAAFTAQGGISGLQGTVADTVIFSGVFGQEYPADVLGFTLASASFQSQCEEEPHGSVSIRTRENEWYEVRFDGPVLAQPVESPAECDGCGTVWFRGESMGEICPDMAMFLDWQGRPW